MVHLSSITNFLLKLKKIQYIYIIFLWAQRVSLTEELNASPLETSLHRPSVKYNVKTFEGKWLWLKPQKEVSMDPCQNSHFTEYNSVGMLYWNLHEKGLELSEWMYCVLSTLKGFGVVREVRHS